MIELGRLKGEDGKGKMARGRLKGIGELRRGQGRKKEGR